MMEAQQLKIPDQYTRKYDRQLRLWEKSGQAALASSHILSLGISPAVSETLKNMVLAGIQAFTIIDNKPVNEYDQVNDFFIQGLKKSEQNEKRGKINVDLLNELNPSVEGEFIDQNPVLILSQSLEYFKKFNIVLVGMDRELNNAFVSSLSLILGSLNIPLFVVDVIGFIGYFRISYSDHEVIESHQDPKNDLRLEKPVQGLMEWVESFGRLEDIQSSKLHSEIPYVVILLYYISEWAKQRNDGLKYPQNYKHKQELKHLVKEGMMSIDEENFEEALAAVNGTVTYREVSKDILNLFDDARCKNITSESTQFWLLVRALSEFYNNEGENKYLPISGRIPDMKSSTSNYITLQKIYQNQSQRDIQAMRNHLIEINRKYSLEVVIDEELLRTFCKNAHYLHLSKTIPLHHEWGSTQSSPSFNKTNYCPLNLSSLKDSESHLWTWLIMRAYHDIITTSLKYPGILPDEFEEDKVKVIQACQTLLRSYGAEELYKDIESNKFANDFLDSLLKFAHLKGLATTSSLIGGLLAQEVTKIITKHYIPLTQSCIYNALTCNSQCFELKLKDDEFF